MAYRSCSLSFALIAGLALAGAMSSSQLRAQTAASATPVLKGDPVRGEQLYEVCMDCHTLDKDDVGPLHRGVVGRKAGTAPNYRYSPALKNSGLTWDEATLDRWLTDPQVLVPGTNMFPRVAEAQDRADIIAYLKEQK